MIELLNIDCMEYMATQPDNAFDLAIVDPPYGIKYNNVLHPDRPTKKWKNPNSQVYKNFNDGKQPNKKYFSDLFRVSKNQIIWGANNFYGVPANGGWIVWDKKVDPKERLSMAELAYSSFNKKIMIFRYLWAGFKKEKQVKRIHPTQKPVALYNWLLKNYAEPGQRILDTHLGSGSSAIAAHYFGCDFVGCEIDKEYYDEMVKRFKRETSQIAMFEGI